MKNNYTVYKHTSPSGKAYIGITNDYKKRCREHRHAAKNDSGFTFHRAIRKYSWESFKHEIVTDNITKSEAVRIEALLIKELNTLVPNGYNILSSAEGMDSSEERRKCMIDNRKDTVKGYSYQTNSNKYVINLHYLDKMLWFGYFKLESEAKERADYLMSLTDTELLLEYAEYTSIQKDRRSTKTKNYTFDKSKNRWKVRIKINGKYKWFGSYKTEQEAIDRVKELIV